MWCAWKQVEIAIVGKYNGLGDSYLSLTKALTHSAIHLNVDVSIQWIDATDLEPETKWPALSVYTVHSV